MAEKPKTMKEQSDQMWYAIFGTNGSDGMAHMVKEMWKSRNGKKPRRMEVLTIVIAGIVGLDQVGLLDGLRAWIFSWFSGSPGAG